MRSTLALTLLSLALVAGLGLEGAVRWIDRPFPGFLLMANGVVASAGLPDWPATRDGSLYQQAVVAVEGRPFASTDALRARLDVLPPGAPLHYRLQDGKQFEERRIATRIFTWYDFARLHGSYLLNGLFLAVAALALVRGAGRHPGAGAAAPLLGLGALWALSAMDLYGPHRMFRLHALAESLLFAAALHMAMGFPNPLPVVKRNPRLVLAPYAPALGLALAYQAWLFEPAAYVWLHLAAVGALGASLLILIASQLGRLFTVSALVRRQMGVVALGSLLALTPAVGLSIAEPFTGGSSPQNAMALTAFLFPLSIAWAVLRTSPSHAQGPRASAQSSI